jgi:DNA-binding NtrC family response regulator
MVFGIVRRHDGAINIASTPGGGTTISVSLLPHEPSKTVPIPSPAPGISHPLRILVVDDEPSVREVLKAYFKEDGHTVGIAIDGREGFEQFCGGEWDLVVTDRAMPHLNGDQLANAIKQIRPHVPVILITGFADVMSDVGDHPTAIDIVIPKPFTRSALRAAIADAIAARTAALRAETLEITSLAKSASTTQAERCPRMNGDN